MYFRRHIYPKFGDKLIDKISVTFCQETLHEWADNSKFKNFRLLLNYVSRVFKFGINMGFNSNNPIPNLIVPKERKKESKANLFYNKEELNILFQTILEQEDDYLRERDFIVFRLLAFSGCRIGEILPLNWSDVNFKDNSISISKTISKDTNYYVSPVPKTRSSNRVIPLDSITMNALKKWKLYQRTHLFKQGYNTAQFVIHGENNSFTINQTITDRLVIYQEAAGLSKDITLHGFRHTHASLLYQAGADIKEISVRLGHASTSITMDIYTHLTEEHKEETMDKFASFVNF